LDTHDLYYNPRLEVFTAVKITVEDLGLWRRVVLR